MKTIIEFCAIFAVGILNHIVGAFLLSKRPDYQKSFTVPENLLRQWCGSISGIAVVLLVAINQPNGLASVGILSTTKDSSLIFVGLIGMSAVSIFIFVFAGIQKFVYSLLKKTPDNKTDLSNPAVTGLFQYRSKLERLAHLTVLPFGVISEDLIYRGYLVLMLGSKTHTYLPWIILSTFLSIIIHLYQGRKTTYILYQAAFALFFIGLTVWTGNILFTIAGHLYYDILWTVSVWKNNKTAEDQPTPHSKSKVFAYSVFIATNLLLLSVSFLALSILN